MGPVTKPLGDGLGPPVDTKAKQRSGGLGHVMRLVMGALGRSAGTTEVFRRACEFGTQGWSYTQWGAQRVRELFYQEAKEMDRVAAAAVSVQVSTS